MLKNWRKIGIALKYTNTEAVAAAKTVKLDDFTASDDTTDLDAVAAKHGLMPKADKSKLDGVASGAVAAAGAVAAVEAAGLALADGKCIKLEETLGTDHTYAGIICDGVAGEDLVFGEACYVKSDSKYGKCDADAAATMPVAAIALATIANNATGLFLVYGFIRDDSWSALTIGGLVYASCTPGDLTQTKPSATGDQVQVVGVAVTAVIILFNPNYVLVEIA